MTIVIASCIVLGTIEIGSAWTARDRKTSSFISGPMSDGKTMMMLMMISVVNLLRFSMGYYQPFYKRPEFMWQETIVCPGSQLLDFSETPMRLQCARFTCITRAKEHALHVPKSMDGCCSYKKMKPELMTSSSLLCGCYSNL